MKWNFVCCSRLCSDLTQCSSTSPSVLEALQVHVCVGPLWILVAGSNPVVRMPGVSSDRNSPVLPRVAINYTLDSWSTCKKICSSALEMEAFWQKKWKWNACFQPLQKWFSKEKPCTLSFCAHTNMCNTSSVPSSSLIAFTNPHHADRDIILL